ncbi:MAG: OmpA family protein [Acidobacteriota bacterium]|nr:OmpA family protein [Acidobacteriota bacterium]
MVDEDEGGSGDAAWLATFADLMSLLLTFFILLLSFATMDVVKFREALGSLKEAFGVQFVHDGSHEAVADDLVQIFDTEHTPAIEILKDQALLRELSDAITDERLDGEVEAVAVPGRGVVLRISGEVLYRQGDAELRLEAQPILQRVTDLVAGSDHRIMIEGHTDDIPIRTARYPSNWELSTARAISAMRFLVGAGIEAARVGVAGYADLRPLRPNDSDESRAANRRVEFVFMRNTDAG